MRLRTGTRHAGAVFSAVTGSLFYGLWMFLAFGAVVFFADPDNAPNFLPVLSSGLLFVTGYWQIVPIISAGFGASLDLRKLLVYPIPHRKLFTIEILLRLTNCAEILVVIAGVSIGLLRNPLYGFKAAPFVAAAMLIFAAMNILFSAGARYLLERLFQRTRLKEAMLVLFVLASLTPQVLIFMRVRSGTLLRLIPSQILWPWAAAARLMLHESLALSAGLSLVYLLAAYAFGRWQFERSIRYDSAAFNRPEREAQDRGIAEFVFRLPSRFMPDPVAAMVEKELRTLARIPRFRMAYPMSCIVGIVVFLPALRLRSQDSFVIQNAVTLMSLYGLLMLGPMTYWNAFGFDRSAVQGYFCWPIRLRDALIAKNIAVALLLLPQILLIALASRVVRVPLSAGRLLETMLAIFIAALYWFAMGNIFSVRMPRAMDPDRMNQAGNKLQALSIFSAPFLLIPIALAYWARAVFDNEAIFAGLLALAGIIGAIIYKLGLDSAVSAAMVRRESILLQLSRSDGPLSIG